MIYVITNQYTSIPESTNLYYFIYPLFFLFFLDPKHFLTYPQIGELIMKNMIVFSFIYIFILCSETKYKIPPYNQIEFIEFLTKNIMLLRKSLKLRIGCYKNVLFYFRDPNKRGSGRLGHFFLAFSLRYFQISKAIIQYQTNSIYFKN